MKVAQIACLLSLLLSACSSGGGAAPRAEVVLPANPAGVLLEGDPGGLATRALVTMAPSAAPASEMMGGLFLTRLEAFIDPQATVGEVNAALGGLGMAIVFMEEAFPVITLVMPPVSDLAEAKAAADALETSPAFAQVTHSMAPFGDSPGSIGEYESAYSLAPGFLGGLQNSQVLSDQLAAIRMPAARNADNLGMASPDLSIILVPDFYGVHIPDSRISAQFFRDGAGLPAPIELGNRGFEACGIIGVDPINLEYDPVFPLPRTGLIVTSLSIGGLTWRDLIFEIAGASRSLSNVTGRLTLNTGIVYGPSLEDDRDLFFRAIDALYWRLEIGASAPRIAHVTAAGDVGDLAEDIVVADEASPFALSEAQFDLVAYVRTNFDSGAADRMLEFFGASARTPPLDNLLVVGSSNGSDYARSSFSNSGADVRVIGENVLAPCIVAQGTCNGSQSDLSSTRAAAAQVSGIIAYMNALSPTRSSMELVDLALGAWANASRPGLMDAYQAVLGLDFSLFDPRVRMAILDVADQTGAFSLTGDGRFEEDDLRRFLDAFDVGVDLRYDLNGDGIVGGNGTDVFDLDVNTPPSYGMVNLMANDSTLSFDERAVTDLEVLCYYAYTNLYTGAPDQRDIFLAECSSPAVTLTRSNRRVDVNASVGGEGTDSDNQISTLEGPFGGIISAQFGASSGVSSFASSTYNSDTLEDENGNLTRVNHTVSHRLRMAGTAGAMGMDLETASCWDTDLLITVAPGSTISVDYFLNYSVPIQTGVEAYFQISIDGFTDCADFFNTTITGLQVGGLSLAGIVLGPGLHRMTITTEFEGCLEADEFADVTSAWNSNATFSNVPN